MREQRRARRRARGGCSIGASRSSSPLREHAAGRRPARAMRSTSRTISSAVSRVFSSVARAARSSRGAADPAERVLHLVRDARRDRAEGLEALALGLAQLEPALGGSCGRAARARTPSGLRRARRRAATPRRPRPRRSPPRRSICCSSSEIAMPLASTRRAIRASACSRLDAAPRPAGRAPPRASARASGTPPRSAPRRAPLRSTTTMPASRASSTSPRDRRQLGCAPHLKSCPNP